MPGKVTYIHAKNIFSISCGIVSPLPSHASPVDADPSSVGWTWSRRIWSCLALRWQQLWAGVCTWGVRFIWVIWPHTCLANNAFTYLFSTLFGNVQCGVSTFTIFYCSTSQSENTITRSSYQWMTSLESSPGMVFPMKLLAFLMEVNATWILEHLGISISHSIA